MPDLDMELRRLANALISEAPEAPTFDAVTAAAVRPLGRSRGPRRAAAIGAGVIVLVATAILIAVLAGPDDSQLRPAGPTGFVPCTQKDPGAFVGPNGQTFGPVSNPQPGGGSLTPAEIAAMPDFIPVTCKTGDTIGGWIAKSDMLTSPKPTSPEQPSVTPPDVDPVYADDGTTVVGHMVDGTGFVPLVASTSVTRPAALPPNCSLVSNRAGTVFGCIRPSDESKPGAISVAAFGNPVYDVATNEVLIGYIGTSAGIGFVPVALVPRYDELVGCNQILINQQTSLTEACRRLLLAQGVPESQITG